jgi:hypothetical protein
MSPSVSAIVVEDRFDLDPPDVRSGERLGGARIALDAREQIAAPGAVEAHEPRRARRPETGEPLAERAGERSEILGGECASRQRHAVGAARPGAAPEAAHHEVDDALRHAPVRRELPARDRHETRLRRHDLVLAGDLRRALPLLVEQRPEARPGAAHVGDREGRSGEGPLRGVEEVVGVGAVDRGMIGGRAVVRVRRAEIRGPVARHGEGRAPIARLHHHDVADGEPRVRDDEMDALRQVKPRAGERTGAPADLVHPRSGGVHDGTAPDAQDALGEPIAQEAPPSAISSASRWFAQSAPAACAP